MSQGIGELDRFISDLGAAPAKLQSGVRGVMNRGGVEMKKKWQQSFQGSRSFRQVARSIDYDLNASSGFGVSNIGVEVGPNASRDPSAALAGIAMFGGSRGGGGTVPEPDSILEAEADTAADHIARLFGDLL